MFHFTWRLKIRKIIVLPSHMLLALKQLHRENKIFSPFFSCGLLINGPTTSQICCNKSVLQCSLPSMQLENDASHGNIEGVVESFLLECGLLKVGVMICMGKFCSQ